MAANVDDDDDDDDELEYPVLPLGTSYAARGGAPVVTHVDPRIFQIRYFEKCMECTFCHDWCCQFGVALDLENKARIEAHTEGIAPYVVGKPEQWFKDNLVDDPDFIGGKTLDTNVVNNGCAFRNKHGRGCGIHAYTLAKGMDYHDLKPIYCSLFPITCDYGNLVPSGELDDQELICRGEGPSLYRGIRGELQHYFGDGLVAELDALEKTHQTTS